MQIIEISAISAINMAIILPVSASERKYAELGAEQGIRNDG